jgi:hypothetical protein
MSDHDQIYVQRIELLSVAPGRSEAGEHVVLTIRPDQGSFRPHNIAISRSQAKRLLKSLRAILRQPPLILLLSLALASAAGCSAEVEVTSERVAPRADAELPPPAIEKRSKTAVAVSLLDGREEEPVEEPSPVEEPPADEPQPDPEEKVEVRGDGNVVVVVEGDLHQHRHLHIHEAPRRTERVEVEIRRYEVERDERCERLRRQYEVKVRELKRLFEE